MIGLSWIFLFIYFVAGIVLFFFFKDNLEKRAFLVIVLAAFCAFSVMILYLLSAGKPVSKPITPVVPTPNSSSKFLFSEEIVETIVPWNGSEAELVELPFLSENRTYCEGFQEEKCGDEVKATSLKQHQVLRYLSHLPFRIHLRPLNISDRNPPSGFGHMNPFVVKYAGLFITSFRETNFISCPGVIYPSHGHSSVQFGVSDTFYGPYKSCGSIEEPNDRRRSFSGYEDSRLFIGKNPTSGKTELYALCVHPASNTLRLSLLNVDTDGTVQNTRISPNYSIDVSVEGIPKRREKNWVPLPTLSKNGFPLLVYNLNPMQVIEMNTTSGIAVTVDKQPEWKCVKDELRGNTNYLRHPTNPHLLFGFCHVVETPKGGQWYGSQYFTRVVLLEQPDEKH